MKGKQNQDNDNLEQIPVAAARSGTSRTTTPVKVLSIEFGMMSLQPSYGKTVVGVVVELCVCRSGRDKFR